jgi:AcrR family transcriptional regulator
MRSRLLLAAVELLAEYGLPATTTTAVCERAGVSRGAQLHHFPNRAALLAGVADFVTVEALERLQRIMANVHDGDIEGVERALLEFCDGSAARAALEARRSSKRPAGVAERFSVVSSLIDSELRARVIDRLALDPERAEHRAFVRMLVDYYRWQACSRSTAMVHEQQTDPVQASILWRRLYLSCLSVPQATSAD